jgi:hypothetical protein
METLSFHKEGDNQLVHSPDREDGRVETEHAEFKQSVVSKALGLTVLQTSINPIPAKSLV